MLIKGKTKDFKTFNEQLDLLISRGLVVNNRDFALKTLSRINYYRLSAYSLTMRTNDIFHKNITFEDACQIYCFDDAFRQIVCKYTSPIEIAFRTHIAYHHSKKYGSQGYLDGCNFNDVEYHAKFIQDLKNELAVSDDVFVNHYKKTYSHIYPFWVIIEITTFGVLSKLFKNLLPDDRTHISKHYYGVHREYVENWLQCSVLARNIAAHGGRFYNRQLYSCPVKFVRALQGKIFPVRPFAFLFAINKLLPDESYKASLAAELTALFSIYPLVQKSHMGFPDDWLNILEMA